MYSEMYSTHNEGKSVIAKTFIRTLKNKIYKYRASVSKTVYIDKLDDIVKKYKNAYHSRIKMKPVDIKSNTYIEFSKEINHKSSKIKIGDNVLMILMEKKLLECFTKMNCKKQTKKNLELKK